MVRELVSCLDDGMDHPAEVEVVLDLAAGRRGVVEGKGHGDAKGEAVATGAGVGVGRLDLNDDVEQQFHSAMEGMVVVAIRRYWYEV